jgi:biopolymer transport protein ExbB
MKNTKKIISLGLSTVNSKKFLSSIESELSKGNVEGAKNICKATRGPVASICYQGLARVKEGVDIVEKSLVSYGSVQMGLLERGLSWISLFIALAPMLGFMGTVVGMIEAFDAIAAAGDISPTLVAGGIKVALLTTVFGLVVAIILQIFYNYIVSRVDSLVNDMEDSSITFMDMILKYNVSK